MPDRIYVTYTPTGGPESFHTAIHYQRTDSAGNIIEHDVIEAKPEREDLSAREKVNSVTDEALRTDRSLSRFGRVRAIVRDGQAADPRKHPSSDPNAPYEVIAEGDDLSGQLARMKLFAHGVNRAGFAYRGHHQNSNTFAGGALQAGELPGPRRVARDPTGPPGELLEFFTPGLNQSWEPPVGPSDEPNVVRDVSGGSGNRNPLPAGRSGGHPAPSMRVPQNSQETPPVRRLGRRVVGEPLNDRFGNWTFSDEGFTPRNPNLPVPPPEPGRPPGMFRGEPMPYWITPPPNRDMSDLSRSPRTGSRFTAPAGDPGGGSISRASLFDPRAPAAPLVPVGNSNALGGRARRIAELAGIDPDNPDQPVPPAGGLLGLYLSGRR
ncbi:MAG: hypothetical protein V4517_00825 [Pseudomonadota bacterium]